MNFRPGTRDEPEINLIPFIDVLLVVLIFLMLSTTYSRYAELQITLPTANASLMRFSLSSPVRRSKPTAAGPRWRVGSVARPRA